MSGESGQLIIPAESVYAVFEAKQAINAYEVDYAQKKVVSVRRLYRTSLPIPHAGGLYPPKPLPAILGGLLAFESDWSPAVGEPLAKALNNCDPDSVLTLAALQCTACSVAMLKGATLLSPKASQLRRSSSS